MEDFNIKGYLKINKHLNQLNEVTSKEKARLQQLFQKALNDPDLDDETLNKIKNAVVSKNLKSQTSDSDKDRGDVLDKYAGKFNLPRTIQKYFDGSSAAPQYKFQFAKLLKDPKNLITKGKLESKVEGSLLDLISPSLKNNPLFKEVTEYLLTFRARGKGVGEAWLLTFGVNPNTTPKGDVSIDGYDIEVKDGGAKFSVDSKLTANKQIHDKLNDDFFSAFGTKGMDLKKSGKERKNKSVDLSKIRDQIKSIKQYLDTGGRKPTSRSIPSDEDIKKYSNLDSKQVDKLRETLKKVKQYISEAKTPQGYGLDYTKPIINKFLLTQKKTNPELLKKELDKYYKTLYDGADINIDELTKYIYDNIGKGDKISDAVSTFVLKQYFSKEGFDVLMIVDPENFKYRILTQNFISGLSYGDDLPGDLTYEPKFKREGDAQNVGDGWINIGFK